MFDAATGSFTSIAISGDENVLALNPVTDMIYGTAYGDTVMAIDGATDAVTSIPEGTNPGPIFVDSTSGRVYVDDPGSASVEVIEATNELGVIAVAGLKALDTSTQALLVLNNSESSGFSLIEPTTPIDLSSGDIDEVAGQRPRHRWAGP